MGLQDHQVVTVARFFNKRAVIGISRYPQEALVPGIQQIVSGQDEIEYWGACF